MIRKHRMSSLITVLIPTTAREIVEQEADERGVSLGAVVRDFLDEGMRAKGMID